MSVKQKPKTQRQGEQLSKAAKAFRHPRAKRLAISPRDVMPQPKTTRKEIAAPSWLKDIQTASRRRGTDKLSLRQITGIINEPVSGKKTSNRSRG